MAYLRIAVFFFGCLALLTLVGGVLLIRSGRYPARLINLYLAGVCFMSMLLNLLVGWPWVALPWGLCIPYWLWVAVRHN